MAGAGRRALAPRDRRSFDSVQTGDNPTGFAGQASASSVARGCQSCGDLPCSRIGRRAAAVTAGRRWANSLVHCVGRWPWQGQTSVRGRVRSEWSKLGYRDGRIDLSLGDVCSKASSRNPVLAVDHLGRLRSIAFHVNPFPNANPQLHPVSPR